MPTAGIMKSRPVMWAALLANDILSADRNRGVLPEKHIGRGRVISRKALSEVMGEYGVDAGGAALWYDAVADNTERIVVEMADAAAAAGAVIANYASVTGFLYSKGKICGVQVHDTLAGQDFEVRGRLVINAAGPWSNQILAMADGKIAPLKFELALSMNAVLKRKLIPAYAAGLPCQEDGPDKGRLMFIMPWQGVSVGGTFYRHFNGKPDGLKPTDQDVERLISQLNSALPGADITSSDISRIHAGLLPCKAGRDFASDPKLLRHYMLVDHAGRDGVDGLLTALGVKYTTARDVASRTVALAARKLGKSIPPSDTDRAALPGTVQPLPQKTEDVIKYAVNNEMAQTLSDVIYRRTDWGGKGAPHAEFLQKCAKLMAAIQNWDAAKTKQEISLAKLPLGI
jgi:glycerol-3-phosphate dehydrogenase